VVAEEVEPVQGDRLRNVGADFEGPAPAVEVVLAVEVEHGLGDQAQEAGFVPGAVLPIADAAGLLGPDAGFGGGQLLGGVVDAEEHLRLGDEARMVGWSGLLGVVIEPFGGFADDLADGSGSRERGIGACAALDNTEGA
jgi:hypothetical protein